MAERTAELRESEEKFRSIFDNSMDGIFFTNPEGPVFSANPAACKILGWSEREVCEGGRALVVDDEDVFLNMAEAMLKRKFGYEVVTARHGLEALAVFKERKEEIDVVLLDLSMPGMDGWETLSALRALRPDIPVIFSSGYDEAYAHKGNHPEKPHAFLSKPYTSDALQAAIKAALR